MQLGQAAAVLGAALLGISGVFAFVLWIHSPRYAETMTAFNNRLRMKHLGRLLRIGGSTLALGGIVLLLTAVLQQEPRLYQLGVDSRTGAIIAVPNGAAVVTPAEEGNRKLNELAANVRILSDSQREVAGALAKPGSSLARKLDACRKTVRELQSQRASRADLTIPIPPHRPARIAFGEGLSRGDPGGIDPKEGGHGELAR